MKFHGIQLQEGSSVTNMTVASGTSFPSNPNEGELFFRSDSSTTVKGLYAYIGGNWDRIASADAVTIPSGSALPSSANTGDLFYKNSNDGTEGMYVYNDSSWVGASSPASGSSTADGDLTGTIELGSTSTLTLATVATAGTAGTASKTVTVTIDAKGRTTSLTEQDIAIAASQTTSGTFADARISESSVTQHEGALAVAASQVTSGTFDDARIAESNVTQHQAALQLAASQTVSGTFANARISQGSVVQHQTALTIAETQITDGNILARVDANESINGAWTFAEPVSAAGPTQAAHLATKEYVDTIKTGFDFKQSVRAATTANITLSGTQTIDGVSLVAGNRVLVKDQSTGSENGVYVVASGAWARAADADNSPAGEVTAGMYMFVEEGTVNGDSGWVLATNDTITLGSTSLTFVQFTGLGQVSAGQGLTKTGNTLDVGTASSSRILVNSDNIDLATVVDSGTGTFKKITVDSYGRVTGTTDVVASDVTTLVDSTYVNVTGDTMSGALLFSQAGTAISTPDNASGVGTKLTIMAGSGTGQANATGGPGHIEIIGPGSTTSWTSFAGLNGRRRGGIHLKAGLAAGDSGATYFNGSTIQISGANGTNNGTTFGNGSTIQILSGASTGTSTSAFGSAITLNGGTAGSTTGSGGTLTFSSGSGFFNTSVQTNGATLSLSGGSSTGAGANISVSASNASAGSNQNGGTITLTAGNADGSGSPGSITCAVQSIARLTVTSTGIAVVGVVTADAVTLTDTGGFGWGAGSTYIQGTSASNQISFYTSSAEAMRVSSSGNLLIGLTIDSGSYKLDVNGAMHSTSLATGSISVISDLTLDNAAYVRGKSSSATVGRLLGITASDVVYMGDIDNVTTTGGSVIIRSGGSDILSLTQNTATIAGSLNFSTNVNESSTSANVTTTAATGVDTFSMTTYRSMKYIAQITDSTNSQYEIVEFMVIHDGTNVFLTTYADLYTVASLGSFDVTVSGSTATVKFTALAATTKVVKLHRVAFTV